VVGQQAVRAPVGHGQDRFAAVLVARGAQALGDEVERLVPARAPELRRALLARAHERVQRRVSW
jgi:hypothetical protein